MGPDLFGTRISEQVSAVQLQNGKTGTEGRMYDPFDLEIAIGLVWWVVVSC